MVAVDPVQIAEEFTVTVGSTFTVTVPLADAEEQFVTVLVMTTL